MCGALESFQHPGGFKACSRRRMFPWGDERPVGSLCGDSLNGNYSEVSLFDLFSFGGQASQALSFEHLIERQF